MLPQCLLDLYHVERRPPMTDFIGALLSFLRCCQRGRGGGGLEAKPIHTLGTEQNGPVFVGTERPPSKAGLTGGAAVL